MKKVDPGTIRNWAAIVVSIGMSLIAAASFVHDSMAQDTAQAADIVQLRADVKGIQEMLAEDRSDRKQTARDKKIKSDMLNQFCEQDTFRIANDFTCKANDAIRSQ